MWQRFQEGVGWGHPFFLPAPFWALSTQACTPLRIPHFTVGTKRTLFHPRLVQIEEALQTLGKLNLSTCFHHTHISSWGWQIPTRAKKAGGKVCLEDISHSSRIEYRGFAAPPGKARKLLMRRQIVHNTHQYTMPRNIQNDISEVGNAYSRHCI